MKVGELVLTYVPRTPNHNRLGIIVYVDKSMEIWPHDRIYYGVMLENGEVLNFRYEQLIFYGGSEYFTRDDYFSPQCKTP